MTKALLRLGLSLILSASALHAQTIVVKPYIQPGDGSTLEGSDVKVIAWLTDQKPGEFTVEFGLKEAAPRTVTPQRVQLDFLPPKGPPATPKPATAAAPSATPPPEGVATTLEDLKKQTTPTQSEKPQHYFKYSAILTELPFDSDVEYRVKLAGKVIREGVFRTRSSAGQPIRFVMVGDLAKGNDQQKGIAFQIEKAKPQFLVALGDIVYPQGRVSQYMKNYWDVYNQPAKPGPKAGAPLMKSVTFYPVLGNHDVDSGKLPEFPDAFGAFYFFHPPLNGPGAGTWSTGLGKDPAVAAAFRANVGTTWPALCHYSFDNGPAHFLVIDSDSYVKATEPTLLKWMEEDLRRTKAKWKFVCFHAPAFHTSKEHFVEQKMRLLEPLFEAAGVDIVWAGHVHNYQRSKPLRFQPNDPPTRDPRGRVNGTFTLDEKFDGVNNTRPDGVIHIVSGGGGAGLYSVNFEKTVEFLKKEHPQNWAPFTAKYVADKHSFTLVELTPEELVLRQIAIDGKEVDRIKITK